MRHVGACNPHNLMSTSHITLPSIARNLFAARSSSHPLFFSLSRCGPPDGCRLSGCLRVGAVKLSATLFFHALFYRFDTKLARTYCREANKELVSL
jgi:hypothetical protein